MIHTEGPWIVEDGRRNANGAAVITARGKIVANASDNDAHRIAACVNACSGISTETLKKSGLTTCRSGQELILANKLADAMSALRVAVDTLANVVGDINPERGYADELEADVEGALGACRSAIAKCEVKS